MFYFRSAFPQSIYHVTLAPEVFCGGGNRFGNQKCLLNTELRNVKQISQLQASSETLMYVVILQGRNLCAIPYTHLQSSFLTEHHVKLVSKKKKKIYKPALGH